MYYKNLIGCLFLEIMGSFIVLNSSGKVLLVDDDPVFADYISSLINNRLYQSVIANSGGVLDSAALDFFRMVVLDLWLPDSFGKESLE